MNKSTILLYAILSISLFSACKKDEDKSAKIDNCELPALFLNTYFTPNGDGVNDIYNFREIEENSQVIINIFNNQNKLVYSKETTGMDILG